MLKYRLTFKFCHCSIRVDGGVEGKDKPLTISTCRFDDQASWLLFSLLKTVVKTFWLIENFQYFRLDTVKVLFIALGMFITNLKSAQVMLK